MSALDLIMNEKDLEIINMSYKSIEDLKVSTFEETFTETRKEYLLKIAKKAIQKKDKIDYEYIRSKIDDVAILSTIFEIDENIVFRILRYLYNSIVNHIIRDYAKENCNKKTQNDIAKVYFMPFYEQGEKQ